MPRVRGAIHHPAKLFLAASRGYGGSTETALDEPSGVACAPHMYLTFTLAAPTARRSTEPTDPLSP